MTDQHRFAALVRDATARGQHPLSVALDAPLALHPCAPALGDRDAPGPRCGDCANRIPGLGPLTYRRRRRPKCALPGRSTDRITSDVPAWWPACTDHTGRTS